MDMSEYFKRRNPFYFLDDLYKSLVELEEEAKNIVLLYERDVNMPERRESIPYETPFMIYLRHRRLKRFGFNLDKVSNPKLDLQKLVRSQPEAEKLKNALEYAKGDELNYLFSLEKYRLERMRIIGWSIIKNAFYVMDWASRVVETASAASNMIQAFGDELDLPAGITADLSKLASLAMDVAGYVQRGMASPKIWAYKFRVPNKETDEKTEKKNSSEKAIKKTEEKKSFIVNKILIKEGDNYKKFIMLSDPLLELANRDVVKFSPVVAEDFEMEEWKIPIWGVLSVFVEENDELEDGNIIMFLYSAYARVLTSNFERAYYECWNRLKMVIKKVKLAMDLLQTKQKLITQLMKASPLPEQPLEGVEVKAPEEASEGE